MFALKRKAGCLLLAVTGTFLYAQAPQQRCHQDIQTSPPLGRSIEAGGHKLHIRCTGSGSPTVVFEAGAGAFSLDWWNVQAEVSKFTRACSYDRAGFAWSEPGPTPRTGDRIAEELHALLNNAGEKPPYLMVGHSFGGIYVRIFQSKYPNEVAGVVLVDSSHEDMHLAIGRMGSKTMKLVQPRLYPSKEEWAKLFVPVPDEKPSQGPPAGPMIIRRSGTTDLPEEFRTLPLEVQCLRASAVSQESYFEMDIDSRDNMGESLAQLFAGRKVAEFPLGGIPLIVLSRGSQDGPEPKLTPEQVRLLAEERVRLQADLAKLSRKGSQQIVEGSGHDIHLDQPKIVVSAIRRVLENIGTSGETPVPRPIAIGREIVRINRVVPS